MRICQGLPRRCIVSSLERLTQLGGQQEAKKRSPKREKQGFCPGGQDEVSKPRPGLSGLSLTPLTNCSDHSTPIL